MTVRTVRARCRCPAPCELEPHREPGFAASGVAMKKRIYVASSWKNPLQIAIVTMLEKLGHAVYDFRNPPGRTGFAWSQLARNWDTWSQEEYRHLVTKSPIAIAGYESDRQAIANCDALLFVMPAGKSASWELGYAFGKGKECYVLDLAPRPDPELMFREARLLISMKEFFDAFEIGNMVDCKRCEGKGKCGPWGDSDRDADDIQTCNVCRGVGKVEAGVKS